MRLLLPLLLALAPAAQAGDKKAGFPHSAEAAAAAIDAAEAAAAEAADPSGPAGTQADDSTIGPPAPGSFDHAAWAEALAPTPLPGKASNWRSADQLYSEIEALSIHGTMTPLLVGHTVEGRPIVAWSVRDHTRPVMYRVLIYAQLHALEWIGAEVATELLTRLAPHPRPGVEVVIVPIINRDGRERAEQDVLQGRDRVYRRANANGVDLNRDFAHNRESDVLWSRLPFFQRYYHSSDAPLSQPETRAMDALAATGFDAALSLHAFGGYIYTPWAGHRGRPPDHDAMIDIAYDMASAQPGRAYKVTQLSHMLVWFRGLGMEIDHMYGEYGTYSFLMELTHSGIRLVEPATWRDYFRWYNPADPAPDIADGTAAALALVDHYAWLARTDHR